MSPRNFLYCVYIRMCLLQCNWYAWLKLCEIGSYQLCPAVIRPSTECFQILPAYLTIVYQSWWWFFKWCSFIFICVCVAFSLQSAKIKITHKCAKRSVTFRTRTRRRHSMTCTTLWISIACEFQINYEIGWRYNKTIQENEIA